MPPYDTLPNPPSRTDAAAVLARLIDAIGFRYQHCSADLRPQDWSTPVAPDVMTIRAVSVHLLKLLRWCARSWDINEPDEIPTTSTALRQEIIHLAWRLRTRVVHIDGQRLLADPNWMQIHGPLADALTHIGQIASWRRIMGNPMPAMSWSRGRRRTS